MTPEQFAYWLQGFTELNPSMEQPTPEQWKSITEHLKTVFVKVTPEVQMAPLKINWPESGRVFDLAESIRKSFRDEVFDRFGPYQGSKVIC
jgi:hypothetical protein